MTKDGMISLLLAQGFTCEGNEYRKDILVFRRNDDEKRFEVFYSGEHGTEKTPVLWYDELYKDMKKNVVAYYVNNLYEAIKTFDED